MTNERNFSHAQLNILVAEMVMGWPHIGDDEPYVKGGGYISDYTAWIVRKGAIGELWLPAHRSDHALDVIDKMINTPGPDGDYWDVVLSIHKHKTVCVFGELADYRVQAEDKKFAMAVCLAALKGIEQ